MYRYVPELNRFNSVFSNSENLILLYLRAISSISNNNFNSLGSNKKRISDTISENVTFKTVYDYNTQFLNKNNYLLSLYIVRNRKIPYSVRYYLIKDAISDKDKNTVNCILTINQVPEFLKKNSKDDKRLQDEITFMFNDVSIYAKSSFNMHNLYTLELKFIKSLEDNYIYLGHSELHYKNQDINYFKLSKYVEKIANKQKKIQISIDLIF